MINTKPNQTNIRYHIDSATTAKYYRILKLNIQNAYERTRPRRNPQTRYRANRQDGKTYFNSGPLLHHYYWKLIAQNQNTSQSW